MVSSYSQDAVFCKATGDCVKGPVAIAARHSEALRADHDLAYESGEAETHFLDGAVRKGRFSTVWKLQPDGHWKIFRNVSLSAPSS
jgi:ketosteroid isomerase-like protein